MQLDHLDQQAIGLLKNCCRRHLQMLYRDQILSPEAKMQIQLIEGLL